MDLLCRHCGEPFDVDEFHNQEIGTWKEWVFAFRRNGCGAVNACFDGLTPGESQPCLESPIVDDEALDRIGILNALLGDDVDGLSSMMDDLG
tara:strand:- start:728 stop:1003 length:276 start_codon:yes stop_codon:yes gene_type:complete